MKNVAKENLDQLKALLTRITVQDYNEKPDVLCGASIGQHIRHILEFYLLLISGSDSGVISYDKRKRDLRLETDPGYAVAIIPRIKEGLDKMELNVPVLFEADFTEDSSSNNLIHTSISRELAYCIEHSIHHMALIKAGLVALALHDHTDEHFGVAYSTIRYRNTSCAQ
ncbi:MAG: hypothetical protein ACP5E3_02835 [Bacteroidales bacterium]